jgi:predicted Zn-dependent peptidase
MTTSAPYQLTALDNGLRVASEALPGMESVTLCVAFNVGARNESQGEHGLSHLLEHMAFKGTARRSARQIAEEFDHIGGNVNAYTSMDQTVYHARVLHQHLPVAVEILADILQNSIFEEEELAREQEVILQEIAMNEDSPEDLIFDYLHEAAFAGQPLGRSILGTPESVTAFTAEHLRGYIDRHYRTPNMVVSAAGRVAHDDLTGLCRKHFGTFSGDAVTEPLRANYGAGERKVSRDLEQMQVMMSFAGLTIHDPDYPALQLLANIFGGGMSSRLFQEVREKRGLAYSISAFLSGYPDTGMLGIHAGAAPEKTDALMEVLHTEARKLREGVTAAELERGRNQQNAAVLMRRENPTAVAEWIGKNLLEFGEYRDAGMLTRQTDAVTRDDLQRVAERLLARPEIALAVLGPEAGIKRMAA